jgi:serine/threonine protein kinase
MSVIGEGTYNKVYLSDKSAVKDLLYEELASGSKIISTNSLREIAFLSYLNNPYVIQPISIDDKHLRMYYGGVNLLTYYKSHSISSSELKDIFKQTLLGLEHIHKMGIIHCDIKPQNILYNKGRINICDFNISSLNTGITHGNVYTSWYRPLESLYGYYNQKSDIWALGCTMWELYSKIPLFANLKTDNSNQEVVNRILNKLGIPEDNIIEKYGLQNNINEYFKCFSHHTNQPIDSGNKEFNDLIKLMLSYDVDKRPTAAAALSHPYFTQPYDLDLHTVKIVDVEPNDIKPKQYDIDENFQVIDLYLQLKKISNTTMELSKNLLYYLIKSHEFTSGALYQWIVLCIISSLSDGEVLDFYTDCVEELKDEVDEIDFGVAVQDILHICNFNIINPNL